MNDALLILLSAGIILFIGTVNAALTIYTWKLLKGITALLKDNVYLNTASTELLRYGLTRGYEQGRDDTLKNVAREGANLE